jgi:hypothetical protein
VGRDIVDELEPRDLTGCEAVALLTLLRSVQERVRAQNNPPRVARTCAIRSSPEGLAPDSLPYFGPSSCLVAGRSVTFRRLNFD